MEAPYVSHTMLQKMIKAFVTTSIRNELLSSSLLRNTSKVFKTILSNTEICLKTETHYIWTTSSGHDGLNADDLNYSWAGLKLTHRTAEDVDRLKKNDNKQTYSCK